MLAGIQLPGTFSNPYATLWNFPPVTVQTQTLYMLLCLVYRVNFRKWHRRNPTTTYCGISETTGYRSRHGCSWWKYTATLLQCTTSGSLYHPFASGKEGILYREGHRTYRPPTPFQCFGRYPLSLKTQSSLWHSHVFNRCAPDELVYDKLAVLHEYENSRRDDDNQLGHYQPKMKLNEVDKYQSFASLHVTAINSQYW